MAKAVIRTVSWTPDNRCSLGTHNAVVVTLNFTQARHDGAPPTRLAKPTGDLATLRSKLSLMRLILSEGPRSSLGCVDNRREDCVHLLVQRACIGGGEVIVISVDDDPADHRWAGARKAKSIGQIHDSHTL